MRNSKTGLIGALFIIALVVMAIIFYIKDGRPETQTANIAQFSENTEHILGNPRAPLGIYVYSDINCPHCKNLHQTMRQVINDYGKDGKIKWVSKHFPLHEVSQKEAEIAECVAGVTGENSYWQFLNKLMTEAIESLNSEEEFTNSLIEMAGAMGVDKNKLEQCVEQNPYKEKINQSRQEAINLGAKGTPFIVLRKGEKIITIIPGALPYEALKNLVEENIESL